MNKSVWITVLNKEKHEADAKSLYQTIARYGIKPAGHFWQDDLANMAWSSARDDLARSETALWVILAAPEDLAKESVRYGLAMLAMGVHADRGTGFPILLAVTGGTLDPESLPTPLKGAEVLAANNPSLGPKIIAKANMPIKKLEAGYRLNNYGMQGIGQWFEVGPPAGQSWQGIMFGVQGGDINAHGVGPNSRLPERCVLEYPMKGLKFNLGEAEYTAWAVKNELTDKDSYYLRVTDAPKSIAFGPMSEGDDAELFILDLK